LALPIKNEGAIATLSMRWKTQPGSCQHLDTRGNISLKLIKRAGAALTRNALLLARNNWAAQLLR
jgi:hypothetical protein